MIPSENFKLKNTPRFETLVGTGYKFAGGDYRYGWVVCPKDQTVVIWDCLDDSVVTTVTLTSSKDFSWGFYRPVNKSLYVMGNLFHDRIDLDPANIGTTFGTVVESTTNLIYSYVGNYIPYPFDAICAGRATTYDVTLLPVSQMSNSNYFNAHYYSADRRHIASEYQADRFGHQKQTDARYHPLNNLLEVDNKFLKIVRTNKYFHDNRQFKFVVANDYEFSLAANAMQYLFKNFLIAMTATSLYLIDRTITSPVYKTLSVSLGSTDKKIIEYCSHSRKIFIAAKLSTPSMKVFSLSNGTLVDEGTISRSAYIATNENATEDIAYNPIYKKLYAQGKNQSSSPDTGIDKIHVYDPSEALVDDMYQGSITVGQMGGAQRGANYAINCMGFNGNRYWETNDGI